MTKEEALNPKPHEKIAHLSEDEIVTVMEQYYSGKKVTEIIETFNIQVNKNKLSYLFPPIIIQEDECPYCKLPYWQTRPPRSSNALLKGYCPNCHHEENNCECQNCKIGREIEIAIENAKKIRILKENLKAEKHDPVNYEDLSLTHKTYLGALLSARLSEDGSTIEPFLYLKEEFYYLCNFFLLEKIGSKLTPTVTSAKEIFDHLMNNGIIKISPKTSLNSFNIINDGRNIKYDWRQVSMNLNVTLSEGGHTKLIDKLINPPMHNGDNPEEIHFLWKKIALDECIEYLLVKMHDSGFNFNPGKKTYSVFENLLTHFSTSQVYRIIWSSIKSSKAYLEKKKIKIKHASNSVITNCNNFGKKAIEEKWELKSFNRENKIPQSSLSKHFYDKILGIGDKGFYQIPGIFDPDENNFNVA